MKMLIDFYCFFDNISDFLVFFRSKVFDMTCSMQSLYIIQDKIHCGKKVFKSENNIYFCILIWMSITFVQENSGKVVNASVEKIKNDPIFLNNNKNNFVCEPEKLGHLMDEKAIKFKRSIQLVKYAYSNHLIQMNGLSNQIKDEINIILKSKL